MSSSEWQNFVDDDSGATYYYNARTGESSWSEPEGFVESEAAALKPPRWRRATDESSDRVYYYDEANGLTQWEAPEGADVMDASDDDGDVEEGDSRDAGEPESASAKAAVPESADNEEGDERSSTEKEAQEEADDKEDETPVVKEGDALKADSEDQQAAATEPERPDETQAETVVTWVKHIDRASGKPYYHNPASGVTQWEEPPVFVDAPPLSAAALEYQAHVNRTRTERLARVTQQVLDPTGNLGRLNAILSGINPGGGPCGSGGSAAGAAAAGAEVDDAALDNAQGGGSAAAATTRKAEWQQHVDPHTQRFYYHNAVTGETQWHKPDAPIVSGLADWVPPELSDPVQDASSRRTVSGVSYASTAKFNRVTGKFEPVGGDAYWERRGVAGDRAGRQMSHFFDMTDLEKNRADAKVLREKLKRQNIDWKKVAAEKKAKKHKQKNEWLYQD